MTTSNNGKKRISVAFCGNSIVYFNDCPRVLQCMLQMHHSADDTLTVVEGTCLRGGTSLSQLWEQGNGMSEKFTAIRSEEDIGAPTVEQLLSSQNWDYCILNDHTQGPLREATRNETKQVLTTHYAPLLKDVIPVILQTPAYRDSSIPYAKELATVSFDDWTSQVREGCLEYTTLLPNNCRFAPVGDAYQKVHSKNKDLWKLLYFIDYFHPSPHGTWLQACVLFLVVTGGTMPPTYTDAVWSNCRYMQRPNEEAMPLPTPEQAEELRQYACETCREHGILQW